MKLHDYIKTTMNHVSQIVLAKVGLKLHFALFAI